METYQELYYHFVWATKGRMPLITAWIEADLYAQVQRQCQEMEAYLYALNGMPDHVHLACAVPPKLAVADFMHKIKGSSAHFINHLPDLQADITTCLYWQSGYGVMTFTKRDLARIVGYIENQKAHHAEGDLLENLERVSKPLPDRPPLGGLSALNSPAFQRRE